MIKASILSFCVLVQSTTSTSTVVNVTRDHRGIWRIPIRPFTRSRTDVVNALAVLDIGGRQGFQYFISDQPDPRSAGIADGYYIGSGIYSTILIDTEPFAIPIESDPSFWVNSRASIGLGFTSRVSRIFDHFIISPRDPQSSVLVLFPETPQDYANGEQWFYVNSSNHLIPQVVASVVVGNSSPSDPDVFSLVSTTDVSWIPQDAFRNILHHLESSGFRISGFEAGLRNPLPPIDLDSVGRGRIVSVTGNLAILGHELMTIPGLSASELAQVLPVIHFELVSENQERFRIDLFPEDYIQTSQGQEFILIGARRRGRCSIATNVLQHVAIHIDARNRRIGFADPVVDDI